jgi:transposase
MIREEHWMEETLTLSKKEVHRAHALQQVAQKKLSLSEAATLINLSYRQAKRLNRRYLAEGLAGLAHRTRGRPAANALDPALETRILELRQQIYQDFNDTHFTEMLREVEGISVSREKIRQLLRRAGISPKRKRRPPRHRSRRERRSTVGIMMQWDGSPHRWFGPQHPPCCLLSAIDDADSRLLAALFAPTESAVAYMHLLDMVLKNHGAPLSIYQDRHVIHKRIDDHWSLEEQLNGVRYPTHLGRILGDLNIRTISAYSPQAKGRVERGFGTLQDRLIAELQLHGIAEIEKANQWLEEVFILRYNSRFAKNPTKTGSAFRRIPKHQRYLKIAFAYEAIVTNDNCVNLRGLIIDIPPGPYRRSYAKAKVLVKQHLDGKWTVWYQNKKIATHPSTPITEPLRSWKRREKGQPPNTRSMIQVYINSKPAPLVKGTFLPGS